MQLNIVKSQITNEKNDEKTVAMVITPSSVIINIVNGEAKVNPNKKKFVPQKVRKKPVLHKKITKKGRTKKSTTKK